jgi:hypothetical protein
MDSPPTKTDIHVIDRRKVDDSTWMSTPNENVRQILSDVLDEGADRERRGWDHLPEVCAVRRLMGAPRGSEG